MDKVTIVIILALFLNGCATHHYVAQQAAVQDSSYHTVAPQIIQTSTDNSLTWPVKGNVISSFGVKTGDFRNKGIDIKAPEGDVVRAAASGKVVYSDTRMRGFGITVILDHGGDLQTVYSYNSEIFVKLGENVKKGDPIAKVGSSGRAKEPCLHFEVRKSGEPVDPLLYLR